MDHSTPLHWIRRTRGLFISGMTMVIAIAADTQAATYYIRKTGNDSNNGTSAGSAWLTIDKAANTMVAGDTVYVGAGTYTEEVTPNNDGTALNPIRYFADTSGASTGDAGVVTLNASNGKNALDLNTDDYHQFTEFRIGGSTGKDAINYNNSVGGVLDACDLYTSPKDGIAIVNSSVSITNCTISSINNSGISIDQNSTVSVTSSVINGCGNDGIRATNTGPALTVNRTQILNVSAYGIYCDNHNLNLTNSLIHSCGNDGVRLGNMAVGTIWHTTFSTCSGDGIENANANSTFRNCIFATISGVGIRKSNGGVTQSHNLFYQISGGAHPSIANGTGELTSNPLFVSGTDLRLQSSSPAINAGTDGSAITVVDLLGISRPTGGGWDMGCYEYGTSYLFTDVSSAAGFNVQTASDLNSGSGLHWGDLDNDGDQDAIITGSTAKVMLNNGSGTFFASALGTGDVRRQGALADYDNDGDLDFWAIGIGNNDTEAIFLNNGSATMSNSGNCGVSAPTQNEGVAATDINGDGWCDVVMFSSDANYVCVNQASSTVAFSPSTAAVYGFNDSSDYGDGDFVSSADANSDGRTDFFFHYNSGDLFWSEGDGTFRESTSGVSVSTGSTLKIGSAWGDYDNDGDMDLFVPRLTAGTGSYLWRNTAGSFTNVASSAGISDTGSHRSCCWGDYDNDGDLDLYIVTASGGNLLYRNNGNATFTAVDQGVTATGNNHDAVFVDYDKDGDLDLSVTRQGATNVLLRNGTNNSNYLRVRVVGYGTGATNKAGVGVRVDLYNSAGTTLLQRRELGMARGYGGGESLIAHFGGVSSATSYMVKVHFVNGVRSVTTTPAAASTAMGATTLAQTLTVIEPTPVMQMTGWNEEDPSLP